MAPFKQDWERSNQRGCSVPGSQKVLFRLACDVWWESDYGAVLQLRASGWLPCGTGAGDGAHECKLQRREEWELVMAYADVAKLSHLMAGIASQHAKAFIPDCGLAKKASVGTTFCDSRNPIHPPRSDLSTCINFTTFLKIYLITITMRFHCPGNLVFQWHP